MNIGIIAYYFYPENTAAVNRLETMARKLAENTEQVTVFALLDESHDKNRIISNVDGNGYSVRYAKRYRYKESSFVFRAFGELVNCYRVCRLAKKAQCDCYLVSIPSMFLLVFVGLLKRAKSKVIVDIRDLVWEYLDSSTLPAKLIKSSLSFIMMRNLRLADKYVVTNKAEREMLLAKGITESRIKVFSNGISSQRFDCLSELKQGEIGKEKPLHVLYAGNVGIAQELDKDIGVFSSTAGMVFDIVGDGNGLEQLKLAMQKGGAENIRLHGKVDWEHLVRFYRSTDILFAKLGPLYQTAIPSKLYEYAVLDKPVIVVGSGAVGSFCSQFDNFIFSPSGDAGQLTSALERAVSMVKNKAVFHSSAVIRDHYIREHLYDSLGAYLLN